MAYRSKLMCDIDGCIYPFSLAVRQSLYLRGHDLPVQWDERWNHIQDEVSAEAWEWVWNEGIREVFSHAPPVPGSVEALRRMQGPIDIWYVTARPKRIADVTMRWLSDLKLQPAGLIHSAGREKSTVVPVEDGFIGYIEDRPENVFELACAADDEAPVWMPRRPWNKTYHNASLETPNLGIWPFDDWDEVSTWALARVNPSL